MNNIFSITYIAFLLAILFIIGKAIKNLIYKLLVRDRFIEIEAVVMDSYVTGSRKNHRFVMLIEYEYNGKKYNGKLPLKTNNIGANIPIRINPNKPDEYMLYGLMGEVLDIIKSFIFAIIVALLL